MKFINLETGEVFQSEYDVAPVVHGKWVMKQRGCSGKRSGAVKVCSVCGWENACRYNFCPSCGAKMNEED